MHFDSSGARRVRIFCTSSLPCDAGFDLFGSERAKGSRKTHLEFVADLKAREGFDFLARGLAWRRRVRILRVRFAPAPEGSKFRSSVRNGGPPVTIGGTTGFDIFDAPSTLVTKGSTFRTVFSLRARGFKISGWR